MDKMTPLERILAPGANGILSARCCSDTAALEDEQVLLHLGEAAQRLSLDVDFHLETISSAQRSLMFLNGSLDSRQQVLVSEIFSLYRKHGLSVFPVIILGGRIAFHSGGPSVDEIEEAMRELVPA